MKASRPWRITPSSEEAVIVDLTSGLTSALPDRKSRDRAHTISRLAQRMERFAESKTQRAHHACGHNRDARRNLFPVRAAWLSHSLKRKNCSANFYCFLAGSILQMTRNGNQSPEVGGLSVEFIQ